MTQSARKTPAPQAAEAKGPKRSWKVHVAARAPETAAANEAGPAREAHIGVAALELAALDPVPLPWRAELERHFDTPLAGLAVYRGPEVEQALAAEGARAAVRGEAVLLSQEADKAVVAHEVAHVLQQRAPGADAPPQAAEAEALRAERQVAEGRPVPAPGAALPAGTVALRDTSALDDQPLTRADDRAAASDFREAAASAPETSPRAAEPLPEAPAQDGRATDAMETGAPQAEDPVPTFEAPPMPELAVDADAAAAVQAEAQAALQGAEEADGLVTAFKDAPPSVKALEHDRLGGRMGEMAATDQAGFEAAMPAFPAEMSGTDDLAEPAAVTTPEAGEAQLEDGTPGAPAEPQLDPTPEPGTPDLNAGLGDLLSRLFSFGDAESLGQTFGRVSTSDTEVETTAGTRPEVPLEGGTDPQRVADQDTAARDTARARRAEATQAVTDGPGPEQVGLHELREDYTIEARAVPEIDAAEGPVEGAAAFRDKQLDGEVVALFDAHHGQAMASSLEEAGAEVSTAVADRDTARDTELAQAEEERARLNTAADEDQRSEVTARRQEVQDARQHAVDEQQARVDEMETQADLDRQAAETTIDTEVAQTETQVADDFRQAETDAEAEVGEGERQAEAERARKERESESQSWWDRATDWVAEQFDRLTQFINDVFDAVRAAVKGIIDAVKAAAVALIDAAVAAITRAIEALGAALKAAVNALLAEHFPALAAALNAAIDAAVAVASAAVAAIGEGLKAAVSALLDALAAAIDAILAVYQAAINAALAIARAALTGDWGELARLILEPILHALGIEPAAFYQMIGRALEALDIIIDDPVGFLSNLVEAVVGGIRQFGGNIVQHLQAGIIGWLTGALGGSIQIPERFDLMGVLDLARQILGLTVDMIRRVAVRVLGEAAVERIEFVMGYVVELVTGGFSALWERIMSDLSSLKDMVLDGIRSFLMERIVMAAISWLAGLFSPVGALVKLVMTIWNFVMFLKDQLARIIAVVQTVVNTMWEIATGVLQPAIDGVEGVLGRLLPIVIDLLARLLGLGNVAGRVREIIGRVQQRIEDALVRLITRVLSAFTGGRAGGRGTGETAEGAGAAGQIMAPIAVRGGGESHTLSIEDQGETVVPMIRSQPQTLQSWLASRTGAPFEALAAERNWPAGEKAQQKTRLEALVARAREEEAQLDRAAELAEDAQNANPATAADEKQATAAEGEQTRRALVEVLEFFGVAAGGSLADHFAPDLARLNGDLAQQLRANVLGRLDAPRYMTLTWAQARAAIAAESDLPGAWKTPAASGGIVRRAFEADFRTAVVRVAESHAGPLFGGQSTGPALDGFLNNYLTADLNRPANAQRIVAVLLEGNSGGAVAAAMSDRIRAAATAYRNAQADAPDFELAQAVKGSTIFPMMRQFAEGNPPQFNLRNPNDANGAVTGRIDLLEAISDPNKTVRNTKNSDHVGNAIRTAPGLVPRPHEWIQSASASMVLRTAADALRSNNPRALKAAAELIEFQEKVRTPTYKLIFKPGGIYGGNVLVTYRARAHRESAQYGKTPAADLPANLLNQWYPPGSPQDGDRLGVLQAHSGGLYAFADNGGFRAELKTQSTGSGPWHDELAASVETAVSQMMGSGNATPLKYAILGHYNATIWQGDDPASAGGRLFQNYYRSPNEGSLTLYPALKSEFSSSFRTVYGELANSINAVLGR